MADLSDGGTLFPRAAEVRQKLYGMSMQGLSARFRRLERYDAFYRGLEYAHQQVAWDGRNADNFEAISPEVMVPYGFVQPADRAVAEKRPTAPLRLAHSVTNRFTGLLFSAKRIPKVTVVGDDRADDFVKSVLKKSRFWRTLHLARTAGGSQGSVLVTVRLRDGVFSYASHPAKIIHDVVWSDEDQKIPAGVLIQYIYTQLVEVFDRKTGTRSGVKPVDYIYRRIIDEEWDTVYEPQVLRAGTIGEMAIDKAQSYRHALGRFPGVWIQNLPSDDPLDGIPDCEGAYQMFETIDRQIAQSNKGLLFNMDPTLVYGRDKKFEQMGVPLKKGSENALNVGLGGFANYLEMSAGGIESSMRFVDLLVNRAMSLVQCVMADPSDMAGSAQSALAIELLYEPMLQKADLLRQQYGEGIERLLDVTLSLARAWSDKSRYAGNIRRALFDLPLRTVEVDGVKNNVPRDPGIGGMVELEWGPYFDPTPGETQQRVGMWATASAAELMDRETTIRAVCKILDVSDPNIVIDRLLEDRRATEDRLVQRYELENPETVIPDSVPVEEVVREPVGGANLELNGAQVDKAIQIVLDVSERKYPRSSGVVMLQEFFGLSAQSAERIFGEVGATYFSPETPSEDGPSV